MSKGCILAVDDEQHILALLEYNLGQEGYQVVTAQSGEEALALCQNHNFDLVLLDLMLPGIGGMEVCRQLKAAERTAELPIIMLTARGEELDKVLGLESGADDYITKPFSVRELMARIKALLRRSGKARQTQGKDLLRVGPLTIDSGSYTAWCGEQKLNLTLKEFELLRMLAENCGRVVTREAILEKVWGYDYAGETRTVDVHIRHLRQKLGDDGAMIETLRGVGYRMSDHA